MKAEVIRKFAIFGIETLHGIRSIRKVVNAPTYFPEAPRKSRMKRYAENINWLVFKHEANRFYNLYGFDIEGTQLDQNRYLSNIEHTYERNLLNMGDRVNQTIILRDKRHFEIYFSAFGIPTVNTMACLTKTKDGVEMTGLRSEGGGDAARISFPCFVKGYRGECADSAFIARTSNELLPPNAPYGVYLVQKILRQHEKMSLMGAASVNTCRIVTVHDGIKPKVFSAGLRCGTSQSGDVDNSAKGGIIVGIDEGGTLREFGYQKPSYGGLHKTHPDTGVNFLGFEIPFYEEAVDLALRAHSLLEDCPAIGWDVAITPNGPVLIEGNDNYEITLPQICNGGLREEWNSFVHAAKANNARI